MIVRLPLALRPLQNDSMTLRSIGFFPGGLAVLALWLGAACLPPFAVAADLGHTGGDATERYGFRPFTLRYGILAHPGGEKGELYVETLDSGALRFETDGAEPLPPVSVDGGPYPLQVNPVDAIATIPPAPVDTKTEQIAQTPQTPEDTVETPAGKVQQNPSRERPRRRPRARLTGLRVSQDRHSAAKGETRPSPQDRKDLTFSFTGVDREARSMKFRYKLSGLNSGWIETDQLSAHYPDLQAGDYRFEVQAVNDAGLWSLPVGLSFSVLSPPWWRRYWFLLAGVGIVLTGSLFSAVRARRLLQMERLRASIAANLHDQIGAGLTDIAILSEVATRKAGDLP